MPRESKRCLWRTKLYSHSRAYICVGVLVPQRGDKWPSLFQGIQRLRSSAFEWSCHGTFLLQGRTLLKVLVYPETQHTEHRGAEYSWVWHIPSRPDLHYGYQEVGVHSGRRRQRSPGLQQATHWTSQWYSSSQVTGTVSGARGTLLQSGWGQGVQRRCVTAGSEYKDKVSFLLQNHPGALWSKRDRNTPREGGKRGMKVQAVSCMPKDACLSSFLCLGYSGSIKMVVGWYFMGPSLGKTLKR